MTPQFDGPIPISTSMRNFGWLLKRRETAVFSSVRPQPINGGIQPDSMVTPCPDRLHTRRELFLIGLLEALPVCPMAPLVFIDFLRQPRRRPRGASCRLRGGSARQMGTRPVYWTSSNLQGCILSRRRVLSAAPCVLMNSRACGGPRRLLLSSCGVCKVRECVCRQPPRGRNSHGRRPARGRPGVGPH